jgi:hypothetical protein
MEPLVKGSLLVVHVDEVVAVLVGLLVGWSFGTDSET